MAVLITFPVILQTVNLILLSIRREGALGVKKSVKKFITIIAAKPLQMARLLLTAYT